MNKKTFLIISLICILFVAFYYLIAQSKQALDILYVDNFYEETKPVVKVCVKRTDGKLVLIDVEKHKTETDYEYILNLYDYYRNHLPMSYTTPLSGNFIIQQIKASDKKLDIRIKMLYLQEGLQEFMTALMWSYQYLDIEEVTLRINNQVFNLHKDCVINLEICSYSPYDNIYQVIYYLEGDVIIPISYEHQENHLDFLLKKVISRYPKASFEYMIEEQTVTIRISDPDYSISESVLSLLLANIQSLNLYKNIIIIKNNITVFTN